MTPQEKRSIGNNNKHSILLSPEENQHITVLLGVRCKSVATTVVQLFHTQPPLNSNWIKKDTGVLCFVRDSVKKNYFFRLFCFKRNAMVWEQELYNNMIYSCTCPFLHTFEGDESMIAFNFADEGESTEMYKVVTAKLLNKKKKGENLINSNGSLANRSATLKPYSSQDTDTKKAKRKRNLTKADIGLPSDFKHISHIGWDRDKGFDVDTSDPNLSEFFHKAGVSDKHLQDKETREFIYEFIQQHGGRDAVERNVINKKPPAPPPGLSQTGPPVPPRTGPRTNRVAPPPPGPNRPPPQIPRNIQGAPPPPPPGMAPPAPPMQNGAAPPPPPPPPPLMAMAPVETSSVVTSNYTADSSDGDTRSALLESIRAGTTLKAVAPDSQRTAEPTRNCLLKDIQKGVALKPLSERELRTPPPNLTPSSEGIDLADALKRALSDRKRVIQSDPEDSNDTSDTNSNDDEWDD